uniref:Uncharacterized protein n=1 Tax=Kalanchoe fedtschenkoi TaxID=63787 RepID=A0A7N0T524_KALFE
MSQVRHSNRWRSVANFLVANFVHITAGALGVLLVSFLLWSVARPYITPGTDFKIAMDQGLYLDGISYVVGNLVKDWDRKRSVWLKQHEQMMVGVGGGRASMVVVTGSQPQPCENPIGDHLLLRSLKNKVDYCRIHGYDVFYNNVLLQPKMSECWAKLPAIRAAMLSHPEAEWVLWVDADALFTDMEFEFPFDRYENHNLVVEGWGTYQRRSFTSLNAGVFLIRNCQWSMDFMEAWASMGPQSPEYAKWGRIQQSVIKDKLHPDSDDQSALLYLMLEERAKWGDKIFLEQEVSFQSHWVGVTNRLSNFSRAQLEEDRKSGGRKRNAEKVTRGYGAQTDRLPIMIHFAGCQPCSGKHNPAYGAESCWEGMNQALAFADNQVLRNFGLAHLNLSESAVSAITHI